MCDDTVHCWASCVFALWKICHDVNVWLFTPIVMFNQTAANDTTLGFHSFQVQSTVTPDQSQVYVEHYPLHRLHCIGTKYQHILISAVLDEHFPVCLPKTATSTLCYDMHLCFGARRKSLHLIFDLKPVAVSALHELFVT